ncbi:MAG TPA: 3-deoxy-D-manno-octulosonic acid transferase [Blastocatellia bacterium]|jgi:3-deoxy-D-manno-octulosonic-acid transferase|nr:3-deoxy-D-manno-octulosonic acid transferase [Blastocatellia bacterium]
MRYIYSFLLGVAFIVMLPYFIYHALFNRKYLGGLSQRLGIFPPEALPEALSEALNDEVGSGLRPAVWIHAVSVGEALAAKPLISALRARFPQYRLIISTTTGTGQAVARSRLTEADVVCYFPFDWKFSVRRALDAIRPRAVILMESELWLNFLSECEARAIPVIVANGRVSDRSFARSRKFGFFVRRLYGLVTRFAMQSRLDAGRATELGAPAGRVAVTGNLKFEIGAVGASTKVVEMARAMALDSSPLVIAGSTTEGEEEMVLSAFEGLRKENGFDGVRLLIAPRHPERFDSVARSIKSSQLLVARRSAVGAIERGCGEEDCAAADVILLDTVGELAALYRFATAVFVGGSLVPKGGHNILEPALYAKPIIVGPHMENFREIAAEFLRRGALVQLHAAPDRMLAAELREAFARLLRDRDYAEALGSNARHAVDENRGAAARTVEIIAEYL